MSNDVGAFDILPFTVKNNTVTTDTRLCTLNSFPVMTQK